MNDVECDVLIVGGGLVGAVLANALQAVEVSTVLVEAKDPSRLEQAGFDARVTALANGSRRILEQLSMWSSLDAEAQAITSIHVGEQGRFGAVRIEASEEGVDALGYTLENTVLGRVFWQALDAAERFHCLAPARLVSFAPGEHQVEAGVEYAAETINVRARLAVAADGANSSVRRALGIDAQADDYGQHAIILNCATQIGLDGRAFERFTAQGPLALLPLHGQRAAVVWTMGSSAAKQVAALADNEFGARLQSAFGERLGRIRRLGRRDLHRLYRIRSDALSGPRTALIGSAAVNLHPVAGQGFNLALRDVATLAELIADELETHGPRADPGAAAVLQQYRRWRALDQRKVAAFTHGLVRCFGLPGRCLGTARGLGLLGFDLLPGAKALLARHTMGMAGRLPRLARGVPLKSPQ